jgi:hypothetical protein
VSVNQRDIARFEHGAAIVLFHFRAAFKLKHGIEPGIVTFLIS